MVLRALILLQSRGRVIGALSGAILLIQHGKTCVRRAV